jgi:prepilin-type processing-associated H-X9-DG protein
LVICPSRSIIPTDAATNVRPSFSAHPLIMPDRNHANTASRPRIRIGGIERPTQVILFADAIQQTAGGSHSNFWQVPEMNRQNNPASAAVAIAPGPDLDNGEAHFRYRHNGKANAVFVDGHVSSFQKGTILQRHVSSNY